MLHRRGNVNVRRDVRLTLAREIVEITGNQWRGGLKKQKNCVHPVSQMIRKQLRSIRRTTLNETDTSVLTQRRDAVYDEANAYDFLER